MKELGLLSLGIVFLALSSFTLVKKKHVVGTWQVEEVDFSMLLKNLPEDERAMIDLFLPMMEEAMKSTEMTFKKKGKFSIKASMMDQVHREEGTWSLSKDGKVINTQSGEGAASQMIVESISGNKMVVSSDIDGQIIKMTLVKK